jgi:hypothetical protein
VDTISLGKWPMHEPVARSLNLAESLLAQAGRLRELARNTDDDVVAAELLAVANRCDGAASNLLSHRNGRRDQLASTAIPRSKGWPDR